MDVNPSVDVSATATDPNATPTTATSPSTSTLLGSGQHDINGLTPTDVIVRDALPFVSGLEAASAALDPESLDPHPESPDPNPETTSLDASTSTNTNDLASALSLPTVGENANNSTQPSEARKSRGRGHRPQSDVWRLLTRDEYPHHATTTLCMHCSAVVPHHRKSEKARSHLKRCTAFRTFLANTQGGEPPPDWLDEDTTSKRPRKSMTEEEGLRLASHASSTLSGGSNAKRLKALSSATSFQPDTNAVADALAMYIYTTGLPFSHMDLPQLRRAFELCLPPSSPLRHSSQDLHGSLLDRAFASVQCDMLRVTQQTEVVNAVCINSWYATQELRQDGEPMSLLAVGTAKTPLYIDSTPIVPTDPSTDPSMSSHGLFDSLARALSLCGDNIHGFVTDNSHTDQLVWAKYKTIFPSKFFHGCASHGLHLFVSQIFETSEATEGEATAPFADLHRLVVNCREFVQCFSACAAQEVKNQVTKKLSEAGIEKLFMPPSGQWAKLKAGLESVLLVLPVVQDSIAAGGFDESGADEALDQNRRRIRDITNDSELESRLFKAVALVDPLDALMKRLQEESYVPISEVFYWFAKQLPVALSRVPGLTEAESVYLLKLNQNRFNAMYGDSHGMAYLLDPRYVGEGLSPEVRKNIEDLVFLTPLSDQVDQINLDEHKTIVTQQLAEYVVDATQEKASDSFRYSILNKNKKTVLQYWQSDGVRWPLLQRLAVRLFSLPASTLPMTQRVLDVALRLPPNELAPETLKKLKFIQLNQSLLTASSQTDAGEVL